MTAMAVPLPFHDDGPSFRLDIMSLVLALALHIPLYYLKFTSTKKVEENSKSRLVSVDLINEEDLNKPAPPPPAPAVKESSLMQKLKMMVHKEPPPPPPPPKAEKAPEKIDTAPKIQLSNLKPLQEVQPKLAGKSGFQTKADAKLIEEKQIQIKTAGSTIAPLSEKKLGTVEDRGSLKSKDGGFKLAQNDSIKSIGGGASGGLSDPSAPAISIRTGGKGSSEGFTAPAPQKADKGKLGSVSTPGLGGGNVGLRDYVIARDAAPSQINVKGGVSGGVAGGVEGGVVGGTLGGKKGSFQSNTGGQVGGVAGGVQGGVVGGSLHSGVPSRPAQKKNMFNITGPLKDRRILQQVLPEYPAWAEAQGIESAVILEFTVLPSGVVKDSIVVRRTTGYPQLDQEAMKALRKWRFAPLADDQIGDQVGTITFTFSLR